MKPKTAIYLSVTIALLAVLGMAGETRAEDKVRVEVYGFIQMDAIGDFNRVDPDWNATLRPSTIPVGAANRVGKDGEAIFSVKQSRLGINGFIPTEMGALTTKFEFDMFGVGPDAGRPRYDCAMPMVRSVNSWWGRPAACSWTAMCSPTPSTTGGRRA